MCTEWEAEARGRDGTREDVRIERRDVRVLRKEGSGVPGWRLKLRGATRALALLPPLGALNIGPCKVLKERAGWALAMAHMRMPARPAMLSGLTAWMTGAMVARRRSCRAVAVEG
jgi:hypothetical protein